MPEAYHHRVISHSTLRPNASAVLSRDGECVTYGDLAERMRRIQRGLLRLGAQPGDRIAGLIPDGPEMAEAVLGVSSVCVYAPLNPAAPKEELQRAIQLLDPRWILGSTPHGFGVPCLTLEQIASQADAAPFRSPEQDRVAVLLSTSGTTSQSKLVRIPLSMYSHGTETIGKCFLLSERDCHFTVVPQFHSLGLVSGVLSPLVAGGSVVLCPGFDRDRFEDDWNRARPTWLSATPAILQALAELAPHLRAKLPSPRFLRSAAAPLPATVLDAVERMFGAPILQTYGMTEAICVTMETPTHSKPGSVGRVTAGELLIATGAGSPAPPNERGLILLRGPNVTTGYHNNDEANREAFDQDWLVTGDEGYLDAEGYLFLTGRFKEFINRGGQKVNPSEVDEVLRKHPAVRRAASFAMPDQRLGEEVAAAVAVETAAGVTEAALQEFVAGHLAFYKVPRRILMVEDIPLSATGKFQRRKLAELYAPQLTRRRVSGRSPGGPLEAELLSLFRDAAKCEELGCEDSFFDYCDSLQAASLLNSIEKKLGVPPIPPPVLWRAPNVTALAEYLGSRQGAGGSEFYCIEPGGGLPPVVFIAPDLNYTHLWRELREKAPVFGLRIPAQFWMEGRSMEAIAAWCAAQVESARLPADFCLAGWCLAGVVAFETARQLAKRGARAPMVVIFNGHDILPVHRTGVVKHAQVLWRQAGRARYHLGRFLSGRGGNRTTYLRARIHGTGRRLQRWREEGVEQPAQDPLEASIRVLHRYQPQPYAGTLLHVLAEDRPRGFLRDPKRVWGPFVQGTHSWHEVPGDHHTMFHAAGARRSAEILMDALGKVRAS
ncbi:MAG: AMP-binding protein [Bryobacterales bacterium]|nr:AMP-binding protein [Bryobacterales bacterium]